MATTKLSPELEQRLERLGGNDPACCVPEYQELAREVLDSAHFGPALRRARALADEHRLLALALLKRKQELCACEIQAASGLTHATVSHHMAVLADAGLVRARRKGKWIYYRLVDRAGGGIP